MILQFYWFIFWPCNSAFLILVPWPRAKPGPLQWMCRIFATGLPGKSLNSLYSSDSCFGVLLHEKLEFRHLTVSVPSGPSTAPMAWWLLFLRWLLIPTPSPQWGNHDFCVTEVSQFNTQAHFHFHLLSQLCEDTFFHSYPVFFSWSHSWVSPHLDGLDGWI